MSIMIMITCCLVTSIFGIMYTALVFRTCDDSDSVNASTEMLEGGACILCGLILLTLISSGLRVTDLEEELERLKAPKVAEQPIKKDSN